MSTHNICLFKEVERKDTCCNLKTMELLDCALIGVCVIIRSNTVIIEDDTWLIFSSLFLENRAQLFKASLA